jgi:hypothetical protein
VGRARRTARGSRADVGLARGSPGGSWHACSRANLGITAWGCGSATGGNRPELGRTGACSSVAAAPSGRTRARMGWFSRARTVRSAAPAYLGARATGGAPTCRGALMERAFARPRSGVGRPGRFTAIPNPDGAVVEPTGSGVEPSGPCGFDSGRTRLRGLGCAAAGRSRATDGGAFMERARARGLGRAEDRGAGGSGRALMVGAARIARGAGRGTAAVEFAGAACCTRASSVVATSTGAYRGCACTPAHRRGFCRSIRGGAGRDGGLTRARGRTAGNAALGGSAEPTRRRAPTRPG